MCLLTREETARIATDDIVVYKILRKDNHLYSGAFVNSFFYEKNEINITDLDKPNHGISLIHRGFHSFVRKKDAFRVKQDLFWSTKHKYVIAKCIIPAGSEYLEGDFSGYRSYASNQIIFKKVLLLCV